MRKSSESTRVPRTVVKPGGSREGSLFLKSCNTRRPVRICAVIRSSRWCTCVRSLHDARAAQPWNNIRLRFLPASEGRRVYRVALGLTCTAGRFLLYNPGHTTSRTRDTASSSHRGMPGFTAESLACSKPVRGYNLRRAPDRPPRAGSCGPSSVPSGVFPPLPTASIHSKVRRSPARSRVCRTRFSG